MSDSIIKGYENAQLVVAAMTGLMIEKDVSVVERFWSADYLEHSPIRRAGRQAVADFAAALRDNPAHSYRYFRVLADYDLVAVHGRAEGLLRQPVMTIDIFRVADGRLCEHWEGVQVENGHHPQGRTIYDDHTAISDLQRTDANRRLIGDFLHAVLIKRGHDKAAALLHSPRYRPRNRRVVPSYAGAVIPTDGPRLTHTRIARVIAQGNFVLSHCEGVFDHDPAQIFDLFRIEGGVIIEHWDVVQFIPTEPLNDNGVFSIAPGFETRKGDGRQVLAHRNLPS